MSLKKAAAFQFLGEMMAERAAETTDAGGILNLASTIVAAYVSKNAIPIGELPNMIRNVHNTLSSLNTGQTPAETSQRPAVPIKKSVTPDYIVCLEDGKRLKMLKRYLRSNYQLSPDEYRKKWGLPHDYPMVAPNYAAKRSEFAKKIGLGRTKAHSSGRRKKR